MNIDIQDKIDNYLLNRMSTDERQKFEQEVETNEELKEQLEFSRLVHVALKDRGEKLAKMAQWEQEELAASSDENEEQTTPAVAANSWRKYLYWCSGIAAVFIVGFFLFSTMHMGTGNQSIGDMGGTVLRGGSAHHDRIKEMLTKGDYRSALALIEEEELEVLKERDMLEDRGNASTIDDLDSPSKSTVSCEDSSKDDDIFMASAEDDYNDQKEIIEADLYVLRWLKAQALIGCGEKEKAIIVLDALRMQKGYYQLKADSLYQELKKNK